MVVSCSIRSGKCDVELDSVDSVDSAVVFRQIEATGKDSNIASRLEAGNG